MTVCVTLLFWFSVPGVWGTKRVLLGRRDERTFYLLVQPLKETLLPFHSGFESLGRQEAADPILYGVQQSPPLVDVARGKP